MRGGEGIGVMISRRSRQTPWARNPGLAGEANAKAAVRRSSRALLQVQRVCVCVCARAGGEARDEETSRLTTSLCETHRSEGGIPNKQVV